MKLQKIISPLIISADEEHILVMHSLLNIMNILKIEFTQFGQLIKNDKLLRIPIKLLTEIRDNLNNEQLTSENLEKTQQIISFLHSSLVVAIESEPKILKSPIAKSDTETISKIIDYFKLRSARHLNRDTSYLQWKTYLNEDIEKEIKNFFHVVVAANRNEFGVVYNQAAMESNDYLIELDLPDPESKIILPPIFIDIIIDLMANARKYAAPFTKIILKIEILDKTIEISVKDSGRGIPESEIQSVIKAKYRASNVKMKRSMGGGYGLTKAFHFTQKFDGDFYIGSELHKGTIVKIALPRQ
jgi:signal transduction histidine kinase